MRPDPALDARRQDIIPAARLAKFAFDSANPEQRISDNDEVAEDELVSVLSKHGKQYTPAGSVGNLGLDFARFSSKSWFQQSYETQSRWFRSEAYFANFIDQKGVNRIILAIRGTWNNPSGTGRWYQEEGM